MPYNFASIEKKWQKEWLKKGTYEPKLKSAKRPFYNLMMFPYPSAEGLHVGNMYAFTGSDIYGRYQRMRGYDVFEPIGLDGFGIHSENYAMKIGRHPAVQAKIGEKNFYRQLESVGNGFAWKEKAETYDPAYYRWTQWIFVQLFKSGLAYRAKAAVNWCPKCQTVLADEQVVGGECERCSTVVIKKELTQWFLRITKYADRLLKNLEKMDWSEKVKIAQKNWIGKSEGASINFKIQSAGRRTKSKINSNFQIQNIEVFTTRPDTIFGATFLVVSPELAQKLIEAGWSADGKIRDYITASLKKRNEEREEAKEKTGVDSGLKAINPADGKEIPVWVADYVLGGYGTGAIMAVPAHDERDASFAAKFGLPVIDAPLVDKKKIVRKVGGEKKILFRLRDWLISRQRYWGPPIPVIFCESCAAKNRGEREEMPGWYAVPEKDLPVKLPLVKDFRPTGSDQSPLASVKKFYEVKCPACGSPARRETDVSDTFLDSAWYFLAYLILSDKKKFQWDKNEIAKWLPVHMYIGGAEHSVLHLLYTRFLSLVFHDLKLWDFEEPFAKFRAHGLLIKDGAKISKSRGNIINPDDYIKKFGADVFRMYLMFLAPFEQGGDFRDSGIMGIKRFLDRIWRFGSDCGHKSEVVVPPPALAALLHRTIKKVTEDIENLRYNTAISALMILFGAIEKEGKISCTVWQAFLKLIAPFAPHLTEELWEMMGNNKGEGAKSVHLASWPVYDSRLVQQDKTIFVVQVNGKLRDTFEAEKGLNQKTAEETALARPKVAEFLKDVRPRKVIFVPDKIINFVI